MYYEINRYVKDGTFSTLKLKDLECKHIANINSEIAKSIYEQSIAVNYKWVIFGSHRNSNIQEEVERIHTMCILPERAIKIVRTSDGRCWADNTHWTIAFILKYGLDTQLSQVPYYIVDLRFTVPKVISIKDSVIEDEVEIIETINAAYEIEKRVRNNWRSSELSWTIENLMQQLSSLGGPAIKCLNHEL